MSVAHVKDWVISEDLQRGDCQGQTLSEAIGVDLEGVMASCGSICMMNGYISKFFGPAKRGSSRNLGHSTVIGTSAMKLMLLKCLECLKQYAVTCLMVSVLLTGSGNAFASRIRAAKLGKYDGIIGGTLHPVVNFLFFSLLFVLKGRHVKDLSEHFQGKPAIRKTLLMAGLLDECGIAITAATQPYLTILAFSIINQAISPFAAIGSVILLGKRYTALETSGLVVVLLAVGGSILTGGNTSERQVDMLSAVVTLCSTLCPAASYVLKEKAFRDYEQCSDQAECPVASNISLRRWSEASSPSSSGSADISRSSLDVTAMGVVVYFTMSCAALPVVLMIEEIRTGHCLQSLGAGFSFLWNTPGALTACAVYASIDVIHNLCLQLLVAYGSALLTFLSMKLVLPLNAVLSPLPWPLIGSNPVPAMQWFFLLFIILGVAAFRYGHFPTDFQTFWL